MSSSEDDQPFIKILKAMGIEEFDPLVPVALNEYAARFAAELLQDAKDYSVHAGRSEIHPEDIKLAVKLNEAYSANTDARESVASHVKEQLLKKSLTELADPRSVQNRYPADMFMQRSHTYIPGSEAYAEEDEGDDAEEMQVDAAEATKSTPTENTGSASGSSGIVKFTPTARTAAKRLDQATGFNADE